MAGHAPPRGPFLRVLWVRCIIDEKPPRRDLTPEEKTRLARRFRRRARLADGLCLLALLCMIAGIVTGWTALEIAALLAAPPAVLLSAAAFTRCPCCGRLPAGGGAPWLLRLAGL